jgi:hypothetical protein
LSPVPTAHVAAIRPVGSSGTVGPVRVLTAGEAGPVPVRTVMSTRSSPVARNRAVTAVGARGIVSAPPCWAGRHRRRRRQRVAGAARRARSGATRSARVFRCVTACSAHSRARCTHCRSRSRATRAGLRGAVGRGGKLRRVCSPQSSDLPRATRGEQRGAFWSSMQNPA